MQSAQQGLKLLRQGVAFGVVHVCDLAGVGGRRRLLRLGGQRQQHGVLDAVDQAIQAVLAALAQL